MIQLAGFLSTLLRQLLKTGLPLTGNVIKMNLYLMVFI